MKNIFFIFIFLLSNLFVKAQGVTSTVLNTQFSFQQISATLYNFTFQTSFSLGYGATCPHLVNPEFVIMNDTLYVKGYYDIRGAWPQVGCNSTDIVSYNYQLPSNITNIIASTNVIKYSNDPNGFTIVEDVFTKNFDLSTLLILNQFKKQLSIYPNPTTNSIKIDFGQKLEFATLTLTNVLGQVVTNKTVNNIENTILEINEPSGIYFLEMADQNNMKQVFKIVKQ